MTLMRLKSYGAWKPFTARSYVQDGLLMIDESIGRVVANGSVVNLTKPDGFDSFAQVLAKKGTIEVCYKIHALEKGSSSLFVFNVANKFLVAYGGAASHMWAWGGNSFWPSLWDVGVNQTAAFRSDGVLVSDTRVIANHFIDGVQCGGNYNASFGYNPVYNVGGNGIVDIDIYSVRMYDRALTDAEIAANYAIDQKRFGIGGAS